LTRSEPLITRDTVPRPTPACRATASRVGLRSPSMLSLPGSSPAGAGKRPGAGDRRVPAAAVLDRAALRRVVDVHQSEPLGVSPSPLEVVQQRPHEVTAHRRTGPHRL